MAGAAVDPVPILEELVRVPTHNPGGDERRLASLLADRLRAAGADAVEVIETPREGTVGASVLARWGRPSLLVNAHLDTVPPNAGWSSDPFVAVRSGGAVHGLGAADTKGAIAATVAAIETLRARGERPRDAMVLFSGDEEHGNRCMRALLDGGALAGCRRAIVCEPTSLQAGTRHRGIVKIVVKQEGQGGHSSRADQLPAPVGELARLAAAVHEWGRARRDAGPPGFPGLCVNVAMLEGGIAFNVVPARAALTLSLRPAPGADVAAILDEIRAMAARLVPSATMEIAEKPPFATRALDGFRGLLGDVRVGAPIDLGFWTEAALLVEAGIDAVVCGPGAIEEAHAADERVPAAQLHAARDLFAHALAVGDRDAAG
jgi:acetylornithine deacetylase